MRDSEIYDVLVIGGGPAGLAAGVTLARQQHRTLIIDSGKYRNDMTEHMHNLPTWDHRSPLDFRAAARKDVLENYNTNDLVNGAKVARIRKVADGCFEVDEEERSNGAAANGAAKARTWTGRKIVLALGVQDDFPDLPGYGECWGRGIYHCLFCHGYEQRGGPESHAGVLAVQQCASAPHALHLARNARQLVGRATIYTHANEGLATELRGLIAAGDPSGQEYFAVDDRRIAKVSLRNAASDESRGRVEGKKASSALVLVTFDDGSEAEVAFLAHNPKTHVNKTFVDQLGLELAPNGDIKVSPPFQQTSVRGVFAAGDCQTPFKTVPNALASGSMVAAGVSAQLQAEKYGQKSLF